MKVLNQHDDSRKEMYFSIKPDSTGDINIFISDKDGNDSTLVFYISRGGYISRISGIKEALTEYGFDTEALQFEEGGYIRVA